MGKKMKTKNKGFTLIELMITVVIVGIIAGWAITSYRGTVIKANRTDAKTKLLEVMQKQERYFSEKSTYTINLTDIGFSSSSLPSDKSYYLITATAIASGLTSGVILTATPQGKQADDNECKNFILNSNGQKTVSTASIKCW